MSTVQLAHNLAIVAHQGQTRTGNGEPYINHPARVVKILSSRNLDKNYLMAGWLHDVVEDSEYTFNDLVSHGFPYEVIRAVDSVTRRHGEIYLDMIRRASQDPIGRLVKLADNLDNSSTLHDLSGEHRKFLESRYRRAREILLPW